VEAQMKQTDVAGPAVLVREAVAGEVPLLAGDDCAYQAFRVGSAG
jgi:hypothetical protein